jgi:hypothetical protein
VKYSKREFLGSVNANLSYTSLRASVVKSMFCFAIPPAPLFKTIVALAVAFALITLIFAKAAALMFSVS